VPSGSEIRSEDDIEHGRISEPRHWGWCYVDEVMFDLGGNVTEQVGPIPRYV
jgi:hypothetical protein